MLKLYIINWFTFINYKDKILLMLDVKSVFFQDCWSVDKSLTILPLSCFNLYPCGREHVFFYQNIKEKLSEFKFISSRVDCWLIWLSIWFVSNVWQFCPRWQCVRPEGQYWYHLGQWHNIAICHWPPSVRAGDKKIISPSLPLWRLM